jgi:hypothetical protein
MKLGMSRDEREAWLTEQRAIRAIPKKKFLLLPRWCFNTQRKVWLEYVYAYQEFSNHGIWITHYREIV